MRTREAAREVVRCCRRLWDAGLIAGVDGNVSVRLGPDRLLVTPSGLLKADLGPDDLVETSLEGAILRGFRKPTSELDLHLRVYRRQPDCGAVVHAHPPLATGFTVAGESLPGDVLPELIVLVGRVPVVPYAAPGSPALGDLVEPLVPGHVALLLAHHGAVSWGPDLRTAQLRMESVEHAARVLLTARSLGRVTPLTPEQVRALPKLGGTTIDG